MTEARSSQGRWVEWWPSLFLWSGVVGLAAWSRWPSPWWLACVAALLLAWLVTAGGRARASGVRAFVGVLLAGGVVSGFVAHHQLRSLSVGWERLWEQREARAAEELSRSLDELLRRAERAADRLAGLPVPERDGVAAASLAEIRRETDVAALALYDSAGGPLVWDGIHRGRVPDPVRSGASRYAYGERPLFSYLYVTAPRPDAGGTAVAAVLLRTDLPAGLAGRRGGFASDFELRTGESIRIFRPREAGRAAEAVWDLRWEDRTLFSVAVEEPDRAAEREAVTDRWIRVLGLLAVAAWALLGLGTAAASGALAPAAASLLLLALLLPVGRITGFEALGSPASFLLPGPVSASLGRLLALVAAGAVIAGMTAPGWRGRGRPRAGLALFGALAVAFLHLLRGAPASSYLAGSDVALVLLQVVLAGGLGVAAVAALLLAVDPQADAVRPWHLTGAVAGAALLALGGAVWVRVHGSLPAPAALLWLLPAGLLLRTPGPVEGPFRRLPLALGAAALGVTLALPFGWSQRMEASMEVAEREMDRLGTPVDPYLDFLLHRLAARADSLDRAGAGAVELLYRSWTRSGLAEEGVPVWLTLWSPANVPGEELRIGLSGPRPAVAADHLDEARSGDEALVRRFEMSDAHYGAFVALSGGRVVSAVVPPRKTAAGSSGLGPLFASTEASAGDPVTMVPLLPGDVATAPDTIQWVRDDEGWRAERTLAFPEGRYHAHYRVDVPGPLMLVARGTLLLTLDLGLLLLLAGVGLGVGLRRPPRLRPLGRILGTFQARITAALFAFFVLSIAIFGTLAYRTLTGAASRTAAALAERVGDEAAGWYLEVQGSMDLLARRVGADLLEYRDGRLVGGSVAELVELGLYEGWVPYPVHRTLDGREALRVTRLQEVGRWEYVVSYRRLPDGDVLATPVPLRAGATVVRRREMTDLLGFAVVLGAGLSLALALLVGRALARPIRTLRLASERVGSGDLEVRIPADRSDEFGAVFQAFNRMVERLRRTRRDLLQTTRRTRAIVEEAATGVVALDGERRVTLVNPRAEELLDEAIPPGEPLPRGGRAASELSAWVDLYYRDGLREAMAELHVEDRRIRVRARRISGRERLEGAVLSLEDVTDELRTERILAWGEMARQVAHEVKNPLTPIKLSVQHVLRAWEDARPEFGEILERNVDAVLREIERLAAISRSFSHFAAPRLAGGQPLEGVEVGDVVAETLGLYATGEGDVRFESDVAADAPPVRARRGELKEVLVNLLENARAAIPEEGRVVVEADAREGGVEVRVRDDGQGIPPDLLPRIFEPRFSTRSTGTGLGLAIVRRLVESWDGTVEAESEPGGGTTIRLSLRAWNPEEAPATPGEEEADSTP